MTLFSEFVLRELVPRLGYSGIADLPSNESMNAQSIWAICVIMAGASGRGFIAAFSLESNGIFGQRMCSGSHRYRYKKFAAVTSSPLLLRCISCVTSSGCRGSKCPLPSLSSRSSPLLQPSPPLFRSLRLSCALGYIEPAEKMLSRFVRQRIMSALRENMATDFTLKSAFLSHLS